MNQHKKDLFYDEYWLNNGWIKVKDQLPSKSDRYWVRYQDKEGKDTIDLTEFRIPDYDWGPMAFSEKYWLKNYIEWKPWQPNE